MPGEPTVSDLIRAGEDALFEAGFRTGDAAVLAGAGDRGGDRRRGGSLHEIHRHVGFYWLVEDVRVDDAVRHLHRSLELREQLGDPRVIPSGLVALGEAELAAGHPQRAVQRLEKAVAMAREADLLAERIEDAEQALQDARAALAAQPAEVRPR